MRSIVSSYAPCGATLAVACGDLIAKVGLAASQVVVRDAIRLPLGLILRPVPPPESLPGARLRPPAATTLPVAANTQDNVATHRCGATAFVKHFPDQG